MTQERNSITQAIHKPPYLNAIKAMCAHCMSCTANHLEEGFRKGICHDPSTSCPLFPFRHYRAERGAAKVQEFHLETVPHQSKMATPKRAEKSLGIGLRGVQHD